MKNMSTNTKTIFAEALTPDKVASAMLKKCAPDWMPDELLDELTDSLRGFNSVTAIILADQLVNCYSGEHRAKIGIAHLDDLLDYLHKKILACADEQGISDLMFPYTDKKGGGR